MKFAFSTPILVLNSIMPESTDRHRGMDATERVMRALNSIKPRRTSAKQVGRLISIALGGAALESKWKPLVEDVDEFVRTHSTHLRLPKDIRKLVASADPEGDGWVVYLGLLVSWYMVLRDLPIEQDIDMWQHLYEYWDRGLPVLPEQDKIPLYGTTGWPDFAYQIPDLDWIMQWRTKSFNGIGMVLGPTSDLCVIDIDVRDRHDGRDVWDIDHNHPLMARTQSGGYHLFYLRCGEWGTTWLGDGVELLGDEKKVTLAPSKGSYRWINQNWHKIPTLPLMIRELYDEPDIPKVGRHYNRSKGGLNSQRINTIIRKRNPAEEGQRVSAAVAFCGYLISIGETKREVIENAVLDWNEKNSPPLSEQELRSGVFGCIDRFMQESA